MYTSNKVLKSKAKADRYGQVWWWCRCVILVVLGRLRLEDNHKFKANLG